MTSVLNAVPLEDFQLKEWEIISGEPIFLVPRGGSNKPCDYKLSDWLEAFTFNPIKTEPDLIFPCSTEEWDKYALCIYKGKMCKAVIALGYTAELIVKKGVGYFSSNPSYNLKWENL